MAFILTLEKTALLYNLVFNITFFAKKCYFFVHLGALFHTGHVIMIAIANTFPNQRMPYCLYIPSNSFQIEIS